MNHTDSLDNDFVKTLESGSLCTDHVVAPVARSHADSGRKFNSAVVIVNDNARVTGGADKIALTSAIELARRGLRVILFTAVGPIAPELQQVPGLEIIFTDQKEILHEPSRLRAATQGLWNGKSAAMAATLFDSLNPAVTVVHLHLWAKALSSSAIHAANPRGCRVGCTLHDYLLPCPAGTFFQHPQSRICELEPMGPRCLVTDCHTRSYAQKLWRVCRQTLQHYVGGMPTSLDAFISLSDLSESRMRPYLPAGAKISRVSNFMDAEQQARAQVERNETFIFSGRVVREKGAILFAAAAHDASVPALLLGSGPLEVDVLAANPKASFSGWLTHSETLARMREARCLVLPSLWYEAQPLVVLEAAAIGLPCIVADTSAGREMVEDGVTGLWFRGGDRQDLARKLRQLNDPELAARMGEAAYQAFWASPPTLHRHVSELLQVYSDLLPQARFADVARVSRRDEEVRFA